MANVSRINGFRPVQHLDGSCWNGALTMYYVPATDTTAIGVGDLVTLAANSDANGVRAVTKAGTTSAILGAVVNVEVNRDNLNSPQYRRASTGTYIYVADADDTVYEAQLTGSYTASAIASKNATFVDAGINTSTGMSGESVDASTAATTVTLPLKIIGFVQSVTNDLTAPNPKVLVAINTSVYSGGTVGV